MNRKYNLLFVLWWFGAIAQIVFAGEPADTLLTRLFKHRDAEQYKVGEFFGNLYVKQRVDVLKNNLALNTFPGMARFDKGVNAYVTELFYELYYTDYGVMEMHRKSYNTSFNHGKGEIARVIDFMKVNPYDDMFLQGRVYSPLNPLYEKYYRYSVDTLASSRGGVKLLYESKFDNIRLLDNGWVLVDDSCRVVEFFMQGWDEQSKYEALYKMMVRGEECNVVKSVYVDVDYNFLGNKLSISADGIFDYDYVLTVNRAGAFRRNDDKYNLSGIPYVSWDRSKIVDRKLYAAKHRPVELDDDEELLLGCAADSLTEEENVAGDDDKNWMWNVGDEMISSHSYEWEGGGVRLSPLVNPSHVSYSTGRGLSYKFSMNVRNAVAGGREIRVKPQIGYNFKQKALYWNVAGHFVYNPSRLGQVKVDFGEGNQIYSSMALDRIKDVALDSLKFQNLNLNYFRNFYVEALHECEISNGLLLSAGLNFHKRVLKSGAGEVLDEHGFRLKKKYVQFAPHMRLTWQPGMFYYMKGDEKINLGSEAPVVAWDVEQGVNGLLGSTSIYTRSELDVQYKWGRRSGDVLYLRFGAGGYFYTKNVYFVDYSFLKQSNLPLERSEELGGVFQLLDSEWYNAENKYLRAHLTYEAPFLTLHKLFPRMKLFQNEYIYYNVLFISHLHPYMELGYGVATPYVDMGLFVSSQNMKMHRVGYKVSFSLFSD